MKPPSLVELALSRRAAEQVAAVHLTPTSERNRRIGRLGGRPPLLTNRVLVAMGGRESVTSAQLAAEFQHSRRLINDVLHRLQREGRVRKVGYGVYTLEKH